MLVILKQTSSPTITVYTWMMQRQHRFVSMHNITNFMYDSYGTQMLTNVRIKAAIRGD